LEEISRLVLNLLEVALVEESKLETIAVIGGTGKEGKGLAYRWIKAGYSVIIGSRNAEKAQSAVNDLAERLSSQEKEHLRGMENSDAVRLAQIAVLTVPYEFHKSILEYLKDDLSGKYLIDVTVPIVPPKVSTVQVPPEGSAAKQAQLLLGDSVSVISAFQNISFELLLSDEKVNCDVLVCGKDSESRQVGLKMVQAAGLTGWDAGPLENSIVAEGFTSILIRINKQAGTKSAGIQITNVPRG
jgi:NADPH-dependent F420 reductase